MQKKRKCFLNKLAAIDLYTEVVKAAAVKKKKSALGRILKKNPAPLDVFLFFLALTTPMC